MIFLLSPEFSGRLPGIGSLNPAFRGQRRCHRAPGGTALWEVIWIIIVAHVVMRLDNVIGVAGAGAGDLRLVVFGITLSIPILCGIMLVGWITTRRRRALPHGNVTGD